MSNLMADSTSVQDLPEGLSFYAGYGNGRYGTYSGVVARFPHANVLMIDVLNEGIGQVLDVEAGDATVSDVAGWVSKVASKVSIPIIYASRDTFPYILQTVPRYLSWSAHYTDVDHICSPDSCGASFYADATQWSDHGPNGEHYDRSTLSDSFVSLVWPRKVVSVSWIARAQGDGRVYHCSRESATKKYLPTPAIEACDAYVEALRNPQGQPFVWPVDYMEWLTDLTPDPKPAPQPTTD